MNNTATHMDKIRLTVIGAWLATMLLAVTGFDLLKKVIVLLLAKMYDWLIGLNPFET